MQVRLVLWVDRLLDYEIEHIPGKNMWLVEYLSGHPVGIVPKKSGFDNTLVVAQIIAISGILKQRLKLTPLKKIELMT